MLHQTEIIGYETMEVAGYQYKYYNTVLYVQRNALDLTPSQGIDTNEKDAGCRKIRETDE